MQGLKKQIGILGGGQLARMMCLKAHEMGLSTEVFSPFANDPAAQVTSRWHKGDINNRAQLKKFLRAQDLVTFESEFVPVEKLKGLLKPSQFSPSLKIMGALQDRWPQKKILKANKMPTSPFLLLNSNSTYKSIGQKLETRKFVLKKRMGGYDGYGTFVIGNTKDWSRFTKRFNSKEFNHFIAEQFIPFKRELAITVARNSQNEFVAYPLVETFQQDSKCLWVKGPIFIKKHEALLKKIKSFLNKVDYRGVIAFELFETKNGKLLVNEVAPRVHNSSHYSLNGFSIDQFSLHLKAITGLPLDIPLPLAKGFAMYNLIGSSTIAPKLAAPSKAQVHWYGKLQNRPGRKMGHFNCQAKSADEALKLAKKARKDFQL